MNCEDFNNIIDELADYRPMSATIRDASVSHASLCSGCAAKLADARAVGNGLLLATRAESEAAPGSVKDNLLAAFAEFHEAPASVPVVVDIASRRRTVRRWTTAAATVAAVSAVLLLAAMVTIWKDASIPSPTPSMSPGHGLQAGVPGTSPTPPIVPASGSGVSPVNENPRDDKPQLAGTRGNKRARPVAPQLGNQTQTSASVAQTREYLPLTYLAKGTAIESGTVIRVELSRAALASLGVRSGVEGTSESVKAEVILGDDGVARAIRLID